MEDNQQDLEADEQSDTQDETENDTQQDTQIDTQQDTKQDTQLSIQEDIKNDIEDDTRIDTQDDTENDVENDTQFYTVAPLLSVSSKITAIANFTNNLYLGTSTGEIFHYFKIESDYQQISKMKFHSSSSHPIAKITILSKLNLALVISNNLMSCFTLPEFSPANIGKIKNVNDITIDLDGKAKNDADGVHIVVYTLTQIRIINVTPKSLRLVKDIPYSNCLKGLARSQYSLVTSKGHYDLIDLENSQKIPLFPISTEDDEALQPLLESIGNDEFLVTCGTTKDQPCMGLTLNVHGDITRGTIPLLNYPSSIAVEYPYLLASAGDEVKIYSIINQLELTTLKFDTDVKIAKLQYGFKTLHEGLAQLLKLVSLPDKETKESDEAYVQTLVVCYSDNFIKLLIPTPRLIKVSEFSNVQLEEEIKLIEAGSLESRYLNLLLGLNYLSEKKYTKALTYWSNIDPRVLCYIYDYKIFGKIYVFHGLIDKIDQVKSSEGQSSKFLLQVVAAWLKMKPEDDDILKTLELTNLLINIDSNKLVSIVEKTILDPAEIIPILKQHSKYIALTKIYKKQGDYGELLEVYKDLIDNKIIDSDFKNNEDGMTKMIDIVYKHFNEDDKFIWKFGLWLIEKNQVLALNFFSNENLNLNSKDDMVIISKIDDLSLKYKYLEKLFVKLNRDKMLGNLRKSLYKAEIKRLSKSI